MATAKTVAAPAEKPKLILGVKLLHTEARLPQYMSEGAACFDIESMDERRIVPGKSMMFTTGLAFNIPSQWALLVNSRSGMGSKGIRLANSTAVIDSDYTGELVIYLHNDSREDFWVYKHDRIAQGMLVPARSVLIQQVTELKETKRGAKGLGSTGA